jgi:serine phosphatase RsbU (regulator of sigma subunit)/DNA-binding NarL/FixJ family response regulator
VEKIELIRVLLVDDHAVVRSGLAGFLLAYDDLELVGEAAGGAEAIELCERVKPDVVLMDLVMPGMDGATATRLILERCPHVKVLILTSFKEKELIERALEAGASGYLLKNVSTDDLAQSIRDIFTGRKRLSSEVERTLAQAQILEKFSYAVLNGGSGTLDLNAVIQELVPELFPANQITIRVFPDRVNFHHPKDSSSGPERFWVWMKEEGRAHSFSYIENVPWGEELAEGEVVVSAPIMDLEGTKILGGIRLTQGQVGMTDQLPMLKSLAAQIGTALHQEKSGTQLSAQRRVERELVLAGDIQASLLPESVPSIAGWQFEVFFRPAYETSGDFYDFIPLPENRVGIVVADVADKGMGAAIIMALTRSLLRTYMMQAFDNPGFTLRETNERMLTESRSGLFVTAFLAVLSPGEGKLVYANAGHNPPLLINRRTPESIVSLEKTGMVLGVEPSHQWENRSVRFTPEDHLVIYTDGIVEAENPQLDLFGLQRLKALLGKRAWGSAQELCGAVISEVDGFRGQAPQSDDITLVVLTNQRLWETTKNG